MVVSDGDINGSNSKETAARINPPQKFWKHASVNGCTFKLINANDAMSIEVVGIAPIKILNKISSTFEWLAILMSEEEGLQNF